MKCSRCSSHAVIFLPYSNQYLCASHLTALIDKRVGNNIRNYGMIRNRKRIGVAVSGGKDSLAMLHIMHKLIGKDRRRKIIAVTIDEGIKGYRDKSISCVEKFAAKIGIEHHQFSFDDFAVPMDEIMEEHERNDPCSYCGVFRRWVLNKASRELNLDALAIGHNLDDMVQTLQLNVMRNEPLRIARFTPNGGMIDDGLFVPRIRPLFNIPEREIMVYALVNSIQFYNGECKYAKYALRNPIRDFINNMENKYPGTKYRMLNTYLSLLGIIKTHNRAIDMRTHTCSVCGELSSNSVCKRCEFLINLKSFKDAANPSK